MANEVADPPHPGTASPVVKSGDFTFLLLELILADEVADLLADLPPLVVASSVKNGNLTFLLLEVILAHEVADLLADLPPW